MDKLYINRKVIHLDKSEIRYNAPFSQESLERDWEVATGEWTVEDGWLVGGHPTDGIGMLYSREGYPGDNVLEFEARAIPPYDNDINFTWNSLGWDSVRQDYGTSYIAGMGGWWENKVGVENYPQCDTWAGTPLCPVESGRVYKIRAGSIGGHCFIFIDGRLVLEMFDPKPMDTQVHCKVGFGTYASRIQYRNFVLRKANWEERDQVYSHSNI